MEARKLLYTAMVLAPAGLLAGIGIHSRTFHDPFEFPRTSEDQVRVNAYLDVVRETDKRTTVSQRENEPGIRTIAKRWIRETEEGKLKPLVPVAYDDVVLGGVKNQIVSSMRGLVHALITKADQRTQEGKPREAARDLILAVQTAQTLKYSSFMTVYRCSVLQHTALNRLEPIFETLPVEDRTEIRLRLAALPTDTASLKKIADKARQLYLQAIQRHQDNNGELLADQVVPEESFFEQPALAKTRPVSETDLDVDGSDYTLPNLNSDAARCMQLESYLKLKIQRILSFK